MSNTQTKSMLPSILKGIVLAFVGLVYFSGSYKVLTILAGVYGLYLLFTRNLTPLRSIPALLLLAFAAFNGLTRFWAISGKFFLLEYSEIFVAAMFFLAVMLQNNFNRSSARSVMAAMVSASTVYAFLSVEAAATGLTHKILTTLLPAYESVSVGFEAGTRLTGILGNANVLSSILAFGIFFSICLLCGEESSKGRTLWAAAAAINAFTFLLLFSMGGTACFAIATLIYLIFAGTNRGSVLVRMLECAVPSLAWVFVAFPFYNSSGATLIVPVIALVGNVVTVVVLEKVLAPRLAPALAKRSKLALCILVAVILAAGIYMIAGFNMAGAYTFGDSIQRSAYPAAGEHTLSIQADGDVNVTIISQDMSQVMMHTNTVIYRGSADGAVFTVPENSEVCYFTFSAADGVTLEEAALSSGETLKLKYTILPGFIANRLQGLWANQNAIQRTVFFEDGMKMFRQSPLVGNGVGSFETGVTGVQDFFYETKYIHNHYIQILLEAGVIGLIPFLGALVGMVWLLFKRRKDTDSPVTQEFPALWAALAMTAFHMAVEVSMSIIIFLCMAFALFGLIIRCCTLEIPSEAPKKAEEKTETSPMVKALKPVCIVLCAAFVVSVGCNIAARAVMTTQVSSYDNLLKNLERGAMLDPYEGNDAKLSYVTVTYRQQMADYVPQANKYAAQLLEEHSNSLPVALLQYYLSTAQYEQAFQAVQASTKYSASDPDVWNGVSALLHNALFDNALSSPLINNMGDPETLIDNAAEYYDTLCYRNKKSMDNIELYAGSKDFFSKILALANAPADPANSLKIMFKHIFDSAYPCDADGNNIPDQITDHSGMTFLADGTVQVQKGGQLELTYCEQAISQNAELIVYCSDPEQVSITVNNNTLTGTPEQDRVVFEVTMADYRFSTQSIDINFASQQTVDRITFYCL